MARETLHCIVMENVMLIAWLNLTFEYSICQLISPNKIEYYERTCIVQGVSMLIPNFLIRYSSRLFMSNLYFGIEKKTTASAHTHTQIR